MFKIEFDTANADFDSTNLGPAIAQILRTLAVYLEQSDLTPPVTLVTEDGGIVKDQNGNSIGNWVLVHDYH